MNALHNFDYENYEQRTLRLKQEEDQRKLEEKQIIAKAFKGGRDNTSTHPTIYYQDADRTIASESNNKNFNTFLWPLILLIITVVALHKFTQSK